MHIKEITIDGFKSYAQRVVIPGFDPQFNAITGLNGSGKSNILDSVCFVLGIQNLQQVRANSLQELVYKQGQAGITKATVSIVFDNRDKERSPVGYDHLDEITVTRQLVIGGRSKYLINGKVAEPTRVQNLFHSVQLNVNNPHFLIMQGRITKVLNMKPPEILGLLEEAAGTKMYESKKQAALRTLEKKQVKVEEINKVLMEDIVPALDKLRGEKSAYMEWQAATASLDRLRRFCVAHRHWEAESLQCTAEADASSGAARLDELEAAEGELKAELREKEDEISGLQAEKEAQRGGEVKELAQQVDELSKRLVKDTSAWNNKKEELESEVAAADQLGMALEALSEAKMAARAESATQERDGARAALDSELAAVEAAQRELAGAEEGDGRDSSNRSLQERLDDAKKAQVEAEAEGKQADMRAKHLQKQLASQRKELAAKEKDSSKLVAELASARAAVDRFREELGATGFDSDAAAELEKTADQERGEVQRWKDRVGELSSQLAALDFQFKDPERGFDRSKVKGVVARLVHVNDPATSTALEVAAGGKLYQVVVDSEQTAKALLSRGGLRSRVTIIPLNKVSARELAPAAVNAARKAVGDRAQPALQLVGFEAELSAAMKYAFGGCFVCKDATTAKKLAFSRDVAARCVTLEGDDFNPGGTLTGGSRGNGGSVLVRLHALAEAERQLQLHSAALRQAQDALGMLATAARQHKKLSQDLELKQHSLALLEQRMAGSESSQLAAAVAATEAELAEAQEVAARAQQTKQDLAAKAKELQSEIANFGKELKQRVKAANDKLKAAKAGVEKHKKELKAKETALQAVMAEARAAEGERSAVAEQLRGAQATVAALKNKVVELAAVLGAGKEQYDELAARLEERRARLKECDAEIMAAIKEKSQLEQRLTDQAVEKKKLANKLAGMRKATAEAAERCRQLEREHPWISTEKQHFGKPGGEYDWEACNPEEAYAKYKQASASTDALSRRINRKVMAMFERAEAEYGELRRKKEVVENDRRKIQEVIAELDEKKREALETTWRKVDADFGSIFSTLLPGTSARLEPPEGSSFLEGLEVRVAFGGVWKESLSELSGGQKSLLALSLILAMLLFKPAPIYILDEVDAALDLSHTQNIGRMIKAHFPQSQFLVVSLKEGMFNNANVIFRTKFVDGVSTVTRTVSNSAAQRQTGGDEGKQPADRKALRENVRG